MSSDFAVQYKHPNWQRKRLAILERADYICESCEAEDKELHVHHTYYDHDRKVWDYPDDSLQCLCVDCHDEETRARRVLMDVIKYLSGPTMLEVAGYAQSLAADCGDFPGPVEIISAEHMSGIAAYFSLWLDRNERVVGTERVLWEKAWQTKERPLQIPNLEEWIHLWRQLVDTRGKKKEASA